MTEYDEPDKFMTQKYTTVKNSDKKRTKACSDICTGPEKEIPKARYVKRNDKKLLGIIKSFNKDLFPDYEDNEEN